MVRLGRLRIIDGLDALECLAEIALRDLDIVISLQIEPKLRRRAERLGETQRGVGRNTGLLIGDPLNSRARQAADLGKSAGRHFERNEELFPQNLAGMHGFELPGHCNRPLVVVHDLDFRRPFRCPDKTEPELVIDADRVLPLPVARKRLKPVARWGPQVAEIDCGIEIAQFPARRLDQVGWKALRTFAVEDSFSRLAPEASDHEQYVSFRDTNVKLQCINQ